MTLRRDADRGNRHIGLPRLHGLENLRDCLEIPHLERETCFLRDCFPKIDAESHEAAPFGERERLNRFCHDADLLLRRRGSSAETKTRQRDRDDAKLAPSHERGINAAMPFCQ